MWVNINFDRRDLTSKEKIHPSHNDFGETYLHFNLIKQNVTNFLQKYETFEYCIHWNINIWKSNFFTKI